MSPMPPPKPSTEGPRDRQVFHEMGQIVRALEAQGPLTPDALREVVGGTLVGGGPLRPRARHGRQRRPAPHAPTKGRSPPPERRVAREDDAVSLHTTVLGDDAAGSTVAFCHGLFGQGKNWTQVAKALSADHRVLLLDMPNHGRSPWTERFDYVELADLVADELRERSPDEPVALVGHSMGGKIAMCLALRHPELVERLVVVDVAPVAYPSGREFVGYIETMRGARPLRARAPRPGRRGAARAGAQPGRAQLPPAEPPPHRRRLALAGRTSTCSARRWTG